MVEIRKKCWPEFFEKILLGEKKFDLRLGDFDFCEGDILILEEYNPLTGKYTGRKLKRKIGFILKTKELKFWTEDEIKKHGFVVLSLSDAE